MDFTIGPRMVKTGLAVALTLMVTSLLSLELGFIGAIASIMAMRPSIMRSFTYIKDVALANTVGIVFAILGAILLGTEPIAIGFVVIISIAVVIKLDLESTVNLVVLMVVTLMASSTGNEIDLLYALQRVSLVAIGVLSAFVVNALIFPPNHKKMLYKMIKTSSDRSHLLLRAIPNKKMSIPQMKEDEETLEEQNKKARDYYQVIYDERNRMFIKERLSFLRTIVVYKQMIVVLERQYTLIESLDRKLSEIEEMSENKSFLIKKLMEEINNYSENIMMMFEGKIILDKDLQRETKSAMRLTINDLITELQGSDFQKWTKVFPVANSIIDLFTELERLEKLVRVYQMKEEKK
ncbi:FUSC family protein [Virgibacillus sediminis]|uniref:Aromatic acid exporter family protein n=1 Tax=Virgibacillus sediminis TaxID=202260 RepID=A0ABV7AA77_9BACI